MHGELLNDVSPGCFEGINQEKVAKVRGMEAVSS
jgi:hypothetical protein